MPLIKNPSDKTRNSNIKEVIHSYEQSGKIGTSKPASKEKAIKQAVAIGYSTQRVAKAKMKNPRLAPTTKVYKK